jgi:hypothetical protein
MLTPADLPPGYVLVNSTATQLAIEDAATDELFMYAELLPNGVVKFNIQAVHPDDGTRRTVRGRMLFDLTMRHFGAAVNAVRGYWMDGTNFEQCNKSIAAGLTVEAAAQATWTGQQAARYGFTRVDRKQLIGWSGGYGLIEVYFLR